MMGALPEALRYTTLLRFYPPVYRFFVLFSKSFRVGLCAQLLALAITDEAVLGTQVLLGHLRAGRSIDNLFRQLPVWPARG